MAYRYKRSRPSFARRGVAKRRYAYGYGRRGMKAKYRAYRYKKRRW